MVLFSFLGNCFRCFFGGNSYSTTNQHCTSYNYFGTCIHVSFAFPFNKVTCFRNVISHIRCTHSHYIASCRPPSSLEDFY